jgi:hypothetical protein
MFCSMRLPFRIRGRRHPIQLAHRRYLAAGLAVLLGLLQNRFETLPNRCVDLHVLAPPQLRLRGRHHTVGTLRSEPKLPSLVVYSMSYSHQSSRADCLRNMPRETLPVELFGTVPASLPLISIFMGHIPPKDVVMRYT